MYSESLINLRSLWKDLIMAKQLNLLVFNLIIGLLSSNVQAQSIVKITAYSHGCTIPKVNGKRVKERPPQKATNGTWPIPKQTIAAHWGTYPEGTELIVEGLGIVKVTDKGELEPNHMDLFLVTCKAADDWGIQWRRVWVIPKASSEWSKTRRMSLSIFKSPIKSRTKK